MRTLAITGLLLLSGSMLACATVPLGTARVTAAANDATLAQIYFWRARPGKVEEYTRYIVQVAEPIDREAQRVDAFLTVRTYVSRDTTTPWTHMRVFLLRDSLQLAGLEPALAAAGLRLEPDSVRRRQRGEYSATLRDRVGAATTQIIP